MKTAVVTGCCGFIGSHIAKRLLSTGWSVLGIDNLSRVGTSFNLEQLQTLDNFILKAVDVTNTTQINNIFKQTKDISLVVHQAAQVAVTTSITDPSLDFNTNALGTFNILEAVRNYSPEAVLQYASTNKVYGKLIPDNSSRREELIDIIRLRGVPETQSLDFFSPYGCSKGVADQYVRDYSRIYGLKTNVLRQSCIYGTHQFGIEDQGWVAWFVIASLLNRKITIYGTGNQCRDILWIHDLVHAYEELYKNISVTTGNIYNVGGGPGNVLSLNELVAKLSGMGYLKQPIMQSAERPGDQFIYVSDNSLLSSHTGWKPTTSVDVGIQKIAKWTESNIQEVRRILDFKK